MSQCRSLLESGLNSQKRYAVHLCPTFVVIFTGSALQVTLAKYNPDAQVLLYLKDEASLQCDADIARKTRTGRTSSVSVSRDLIVVVASQDYVYHRSAHI